MDRTMQMWAEQQERDLAEYEQAMREQYEQAMREQYEQAMREQYEADMRHGEQEDTPTTAAPLRQLFAHLGIPADEAVERRAVELAAVLDTAPPALTREQAEAKLAQWPARERQRVVDALYGPAQPEGEEGCRG